MAIFLSENKTQEHQLGIRLPLKDSYLNRSTQNAQRNEKKILFYISTRQLLFSKQSKPKYTWKFRTQNKIEYAKSAI